MLVRRASPADADGIARLTDLLGELEGTASSHSPWYVDLRWPQQALAPADYCRMHPETVWVAVEGRTLLGFVTTGFRARRRAGRIFRLSVDPDFEGVGIGVRLARTAADALINMGAHNLTTVVRKGSPKERTFATLGFAPVRKTLGGYLMRKRH